MLSIMTLTRAQSAAACALLVLAVAGAQLVVPRRLQSLDVDSVLASDRLLDGYVRCLKGTAFCNADGALLKRILLEAMATNCLACTSKQKSDAMKVIAHLAANRTSDWEQLRQIYDPTGLYLKRLRQMG